MTTKRQTIDQVLKLSMRVARSELKNPRAVCPTPVQTAILAVCQHLSHAASYRADIAELVRLSVLATVSEPSKSAASVSNTADVNA